MWCCELMTCPYKTRHLRFYSILLLYSSFMPVHKNMFIVSNEEQIWSKFWTCDQGLYVQLLSVGNQQSDIQWYNGYNCKKITCFIRISMTHFLKVDFISVLLYCFWSFGINSSNTFSIENWVPLKPVLGGVRDVALFIISHEQTQ